MNSTKTFNLVFIIKTVKLHLVFVFVEFTEMGLFCMHLVNVVLTVDVVLKRGLCINNDVVF